MPTTANDPTKPHAASNKPGDPVPPAYRLAAVPRVEIFADGIFRGRKYTTDEIDTFIANFNRFGPAGLDLLSPPIVLGHEEHQRFLEQTDIPAAGVVSRVWREGEQFFADFADVPEPIAALIAAKAYRKCSIEHYDHDRPFDAGDGNIYGELILRRIALLGGELPQVKTLADLPVPVFQYADKRVTVYRSPTGDACFAFSEGSSMTKADLIAALKKTKRFASCFADAGMDRESLLAKVKAVLPGLDAASLDGFSDEQLMILALGASGPAPAPEAPAEMADFDRAKAIADLVAAGEDPAKLEAMTDADLMALHAQLTGVQYKEKTVKPTPTPTPAKTPVQSPELAAAFAEQQATIASLKKSNAEMEAANKRAQEKLVAARKADVASFCDQMTRDGKLLPAHRPMVEAALLTADDVEQSHKFSESDGKTVTVTAYEAKRREVANWPVVVKFGERLHGKAGQTSDDEEIAKVKEFAAKYSESFPRKDLVAAFIELRKKNPKVTAKQYIGSDLIPG
jgi:hypothetical protein